MKKLIMKIIIIITVITIVIILLLPNRSLISPDIKVIDFDIYESDIIAADEDIFLILILQNALDVPVEGIIINEKQILKKDFTANSSNGRIIFKYPISNIDFDDEDLLLVLETIILAEQRIDAYNVIYRELSKKN